MNKLLKAGCLPALLVFLAACGSGTKPGGDSPPASPEEITLASLKLRSLDGVAIDPVNFAGKKVFVNFWATWCKPCLAEMPSISRAAELLDDENVIFIAASDEKLERIKNFKEKNDYRFDILSTGANLSVLEIYALPATFIFDEKGNLVFKETGARQWDSSESIGLITENHKL